MLNRRYFLMVAAAASSGVGALAPVGRAVAQTVSHTRAYRYLGKQAMLNYSASGMVEFGKLQTEAAWLMMGNSEFPGIDDAAERLKDAINNGR